jgi:hypothetical protein
MLIRTIQDFDRYVKAEGRCDYCEKKLIAPPVVTINGHHSHIFYHLGCAIKLAYSILFELTGKPDLP